VEAGAFWDGEGASGRVGAALNRRRAAGVGARTRAVMAGGAEGRLLRPAARRGAAKLLTADRLAVDGDGVCRACARAPSQGFLFSSSLFPLPCRLITEVLGGVFRMELKSFLMAWILYIRDEYSTSIPIFYMVK